MTITPVLVMGIVNPPGVLLPHTGASFNNDLSVWQKLVACADPPAIP